MILSLSQSSNSKVPWLEEGLVPLEETAGGIEPLTGRLDIVVVDDTFIRGVNKEFRGKDEATDVISFLPWNSFIRKHSKPILTRV